VDGFDGWMGGFGCSALARVMAIGCSTFYGYDRPDFMTKLGPKTQTWSEAGRVF